MSHLLKLLSTLLITVFLNTANASVITHELIVSPYQVCLDGVDCSDTSMIENGDLEAYADSFFSVVGLDLIFEDTKVLNVDTSGLDAHHFAYEERFDLYPVLAGLGTEHFNFTKVPAFFDYDTDAGILGLGWLGSAGISVNVISDYVDNMVTFIHEIGHNLGLDHYFEFGIGATNNFMDYSPCAYNCTIDESQITQIRTSFEQEEYSFIHAINGNGLPDTPNQVPEPTSWLLFISCLVLLISRSKWTKLSKALQA
jgi:hypothetical protein